jgi:hypothetical protein
MGSGTTFLLLVVVALACMWAIRYTSSQRLDAVLVRAAAIAWTAAGTVGAGGWIGAILTGLRDGLNGAGQAILGAAVGSTAIWIAWLVLALYWVLTMLPAKYFNKSMPDWLMYAGLLLPSLAVTIPGKLGHGLAQIILGLSHAMVTGVTGLVS